MQASAAGTTTMWFGTEDNPVSGDSDFQDRVFMVQGNFIVSPVDLLGVCLE